MILLEVVVQILAGPVNHLAPELIPDRTRIGIVAIARYSIGGLSSDLESFGIECLGCCHVSGFTEADIDQIPVPVNRPEKIRSTCRRPSHRFHRRTNFPQLYRDDLCADPQ